MLSGLCKYLPRVLGSLDKDLVTLTRACGALLKKVDDAHKHLKGHTITDDLKWKVLSVLSFQPVADVLAEMIRLDDLRQMLKVKMDISKPSYVKAASDVISGYIAAGAVGVIDKPLEKQPKAIAYNFGVEGPGGRNKADVTPYLDIWRRFENGAFHEQVKGLLQRGVTEDPRYLTPKT